MQRTAIIGTGIAGMGCGHFLFPHTALNLYEQNDYIGGHTHTVTVEEEGRPVYIDTGFMVFNYKTEDAFTSALQLCRQLLRFPSEEELWKAGS